MPEPWEIAVENLSNQVTKSCASQEKLSDTMTNYMLDHKDVHTNLEVRVAENKMKTSHLVLLVGGIPGLTTALLLLSKYLPV